MDIRRIINGRITLGDIRSVCRRCSEAENDDEKAALFTLIHDTDDRVSYNALWIFTHFSSDDSRWLDDKRNEIIDTLLTTGHTGKRRLMLTLLDRMTISAAQIRSDYLDFCLSKINSTEPYGIRALCIRQSFAQCRFYPELIAELNSELERIEFGASSRAILTTKRIILDKIAKLNK